MKKLISAVFAFAIAAGVMAGMTVANAASNGAGTAEDPYIVSTAADWEGATKTGYIQLGADITTETAQRTAGKFTLDLNGHTLSSNKATVIEVYTNHTFTLTDTGVTKGKLINSSTGYGVKVSAVNSTFNFNGAAIQSGGQGVLVNGTGAVMNVTNGVVDSVNIAMNIAGSTTATINGITVNSNPSYTGTSMNIAGTADVTINNATINYNGTANSVVVSGKSNITINGGAFYNPNRTKAAIVNDKNFSGVLTINGGTFENTNATAATSYSLMDGNEGAGSPSIIINGGNFKSPFTITKSAQTVTSIQIKGGTFVFDPTSKVDTENYDVTDNGNGTYTVTAKSAPATVTGYYTFEKTDDEAQSYSTVKITVLENAETKQGTAPLPTVVELSQGATFGLTIEGIPADVTITGITLE